MRWFHILQGGDSRHHQLQAWCAWFPLSGLRLGKSASQSILDRFVPVAGKMMVIICSSCWGRWCWLCVPGCWQCWPAGPGACPSLGGWEHRPLWRRPQQGELTIFFRSSLGWLSGDHLRRVCRQQQCLAAGASLVNFLLQHSVKNLPTRRCSSFSRRCPGARSRGQFFKVELLWGSAGGLQTHLRRWRYDKIC